ncbi:site-specific integrase [Pseudomonas syringae]|uniref:site-specific integrase n=1 Tax=Pseudomonas syringae TaxID=317 RepID=UPI001F36D232|nr:site-specific integrase [Pseudomonas syringae]MCF5220703.1 site-specific integrase [Pseudomonas syringae]
MINVSKEIRLFAPEKLHAASKVIFSKMTEPLTSKRVNLNEYSSDRQYHKRHAIVKFCRLRSARQTSESDLNNIFKITLLEGDGGPPASTLYHQLTGIRPDRPEDVTGLVVPFKALLCLLWAEKIVTLPFTFELSSAWKKNPELEKHTCGFIFEVAKGSNNIERASRRWQYRTSWQSKDDVNFDEIWAAIPEIVSLKLDKGNKHFSFIPWLKKFSAMFSEIVSPEQCFYLERYQMYLISKRAHNESIAQNIKDYDEYVKYYVMTPEEASNIPTHDRKLRRYKIRNINREYARSSPTAKLKRKERTIIERQMARIEKAQRVADESEALYNELHSSISAEDYLLLLSLPPRKPDFNWVTNDFYPGRSHIEIEKTYRQWVTMAEIFVAKLINPNNPKNSRSYIDNQIQHIKFLFDYIFFYLPMWKELHPTSTLRLPETIIDFERVVFWCDDLIDHETVQSIYRDHDISGKLEMPLTGLKLRTLMFTEKSTKPFVNSVHLFFELVRTYGAPHGFVDGGYANPVNRSMDSTGSGGRSKSDKKPFPRDISIIAKAYMSALDAIGINIRNSILDGRIAPETIAEIKSSDWIDLTKIHLGTTVTLRSSKRPLETYQIPITIIPNIYNWWYGDYHSTNAATIVTAYLPWLSTLRMLAIGLFGGQRIQNGQWLDLRTFDNFYHEKYVDAFNLCTLHVNTDKSGKSRDVVIDGDVMKSLIDERYFQTEVYTRAPGLVYYENDPRDPNKYGMICPLFRSPWGDHDLPFSDGTYSDEWIHFCRGLEQVYNSIVSPDSHHSFITISASGNELAVHVPHSLRVAWISHMRLYGHLDVTYTAQQAGHKINDQIAVTTDYYTVVTPEDMLENIGRANSIVTDSAYEALMGKINQPSSPGSAIVKGWHENKAQLVKDQKFRSQQFYLIDSQESGTDLIATTKAPPGFYTHCICMRDGDCPKKLVEFTGRSRVCSLCDAAVWGIDHLPGMNVKMRQAQINSLQLVDKISQLADAAISQAEMEPYHHELTIARYEIASYKHLADHLNEVLDSDNKNPGYISRYRDLVGAKRHAVDMSNPLHRVIAGIIDSEAYPHLTSANYPYMVERLAKNPDLLKLELSDPTSKQLIACQIATILRSSDFTFEEVITLVSDPYLALEREKIE